jgi:hypothetical protein
MKNTLNKSMTAAVFVLLCAAVWAQTTKNPQQKDEQAVENVVMELFSAMRHGDSSALHKTFLDNARLVTSYVNREGIPGTEEISLKDFLIAVGTPHTEEWREIPETVTVRVDDNMAVAWVPYSFYVNDRFSHCGVDAFQLVRTADGWKILNLTDTRRVKGCE